MKYCEAANSSGGCAFGEGHTCDYHLFPDTPYGGPTATVNGGQFRSLLASPKIRSAISVLCDLGFTADEVEQLRLTHVRMLGEERRVAAGGSGV
jgi:hypothetical protein